MRKRCRFSTALKMFLLLFMTCVHFMAKAQTLVGQTLDAAPGDAFIYQSQSAPHYGIKWTSDTWAPGASTAWFSSYAGIKFLQRHQETFNRC
ncbi:hypothetical protein [Niabella hibiscisoli]|uniref:hypothetical protein n=1 Tax=Niabella hibiscisoli TaxID=1825928 RepID=UPI001F105880|nr:hypothetical protein [Niabella hibiscisoli]MCH5718176.1 hypothetical protein [Niabella hibiscisoli]